ncbi:MAG: hypothetical protein QM759_08690 [Terricaulis sp.]
MGDAARGLDSTMLAIVALLSAPFLMLALIHFLSTRALPLAAAGCTIWTTGATSGNWPAAVLAGICVGAIVHVGLEQLSRVDSARPLVRLVELSAGAAIVGIFAFAIFYSSGVRNAALALAVVAATGIAIISTLRFRAA